jgi:phosphoglycolate phosphatase-like HAD superfamily hydrolase
VASEPKAIVLFDIDGTLLRGAGPHHKDALIAGIRRVTGLETSLDGVATSGTLDRDLIVLMLRAAGYADEETHAVLPEIVKACQDAYLQNCASDLRQFVCLGVREFLEQVREYGVVLGLVTGNLSAIGWKKVELAGLREYFSAGAFSEEGHTRAELARIAAERARAYYWNEQACPISLIGDHANDIQAAKANGFQSIAVATGISSAAELEKFSPDIVVRDLRELSVKRLMDWAMVRETEEQSQPST